MPIGGRLRSDVQKHVGSNINGVSVAILFFGGVLAYSAVKGESFSTAMRDLLSGKNPSADAPSAAAAAGKTKIPAASGGLGSSSEDSASLGARHDPTTNRAMGQALATAHGWGTGQQWNALDSLWRRESGWDNIAMNASGAFGIPQALPATKMPRIAQRIPAGGRADPGAQIRWGLKYIRQTYGTPVKAWEHEQANGWY